MKRIYIALFSLCSLLVVSCSDDYLDKNPISDVSEESFFVTASDLELYTNGFYLLLPNNSGRNEIFTDDYYCGDIVQNSLSDLMIGARIVPTSGGGWDWTAHRDINYFLENYEKCDDEAAKKRYGGVARFFRAYFYLTWSRILGTCHGMTKPWKLMMKTFTRPVIADNTLWTGFWRTWIGP